MSERKPKLMTSRELIERCGQDPDKPLTREELRFPSEMRMRPASDEEAQRGLNDLWPGDLVPDNAPLSPQPDTDVVERVARAMEEVDTRGEPNRLPWQDYAHMATAALNASTPEIQAIEQLRAFKARVLAAVQFEEPVVISASAILDDLAAGLSLRATAAKNGTTLSKVRTVAKTAALKQDEENHDK